MGRGISYPANNTANKTNGIFLTEKGACVPGFIDNIFVMRNLVPKCLLSGRIPSAVGYQPLASEMAEITRAYYFH